MLVHQNMLDLVVCIKLCKCTQPIAGKCCIVESGFALGVCQFRKESRHGKLLYIVYFGIEHLWNSSFLARGSFVRLGKGTLVLGKQ